MEKPRQPFSSTVVARARFDRLSAFQTAANDVDDGDDFGPPILLVAADGKSVGGPTDGAPIHILWRVRDLADREALLGAIRAAAAHEHHQTHPIWMQQRGLVFVRAAPQRGHAVVTLRRPGWSLRALTPDVVSRSFGASRAEAEIALMLAHGATAAEVASRRQVRKDTVRSQIKSLMRKAGVRTRTELTVSLIEVGAEFSWSLTPSAGHR